MMSTDDGSMMSLDLFGIGGGAYGDLSINGDASSCGVASRLRQRHAPARCRRRAELRPRRDLRQRPRRRLQRCRRRRLLVHAGRGAEVFPRPARQAQHRRLHRREVRPVRATASSESGGRAWARLAPGPRPATSSTTTATAAPTTGCAATACSTARRRAIRASRRSRPTATLALKGELFFTGAATKWTWTVSGGPCDQLFASTAFTPKIDAAGAEASPLTNGNTQDAKRSLHALGRLHGDHDGGRQQRRTPTPAPGCSTCRARACASSCAGIIKARRRRAAPTSTCTCTRSTSTTPRGSARRRNPTPTTASSTTAPPTRATTTSLRRRCQLGLRADAAGQLLGRQERRRVDADAGHGLLQPAARQRQHQHAVGIAENTNYRHAQGRRLASAPWFTTIRTCSILPSSSTRSSTSTAAATCWRPSARRPTR